MDGCSFKSGSGCGHSARNPWAAASRQTAKSARRLLLAVAGERPESIIHRMNPATFSGVRSVSNAGRPRKAEKTTAA
jgi:hypothetical protein